MATVSQFASGRSRIPLESSYLSVASGGSTTVATTLYYCLQLENQAGLNLLSLPVGPVTVGIGQQLTISLPSTIRKSGEGGFRFVISASTSADFTTFSQLACLDIYSLSGGVLVANSFPLTLTLSRDEHFKLLASVANPESLPTGSNLVNGMVRAVDSTGKLYEYNSAPIWLQNHDRIAASPGLWVRTASYFTDILATTDGGGCDRSLTPLNASLVKVPSYGVNGSSIPTTFWLQNRGSEAVPSGTRVGFTITSGGDTITDLISSAGAMRVCFEGIVKTDATLDTAVTGAGLERLFQNRKTNLVLPRDLEPGESYGVSCTFNTLPSQLDERVAAGERVKVYPTLYDEAGTFENSGLIWGDLVVLTENPNDQLRRVLPSNGLEIAVGIGSGCVDSFFFVDAPATTVSLPEDTADLKIGINGSGSVYYLPGSVSGYEAVRAVVSTVDGVGAAGEWSSYSAVALNAGLDITCNYPYSATSEKATIRADYPDTAIAGTDCNFNATDVTVYVQRQSNSQIRAFSGLTLLAGVSQVFSIGDWLEGTVISSLPTPDEDFGFYEPGACSFVTQASAGSFPADSYRVCFAFEYNSTVSAISHSPADGCIQEVTTSISSIYEVGRSWGAAVYLDSIRDIPQIATYPGQSRRVISEAFVVYFDPFSTAADDGTNVWRPTWRTSGQTGRWLRQLSMNDAEILDAIKRVDGTGSGLDADLLDGQHATAFATASHTHSNATTSASGFMSSSDKTKLDGIATGATANAGTVTSVGLSLPSLFSVSGSPVTGSGTLSATLANASANQVLAGPSSGGAAAPTLRSLTMVDLPSNVVRAATAPTITGQTIVWNNSLSQWDVKLMGVSATISVTITSGNTTSSAFSITKQIIFAFAPNTSSIRTIKIQYTEDGGTTWVDTGVSFDTVTTSPGTSINSDTLSKIAGLTGIDSSGNGLSNLRLSMNSSLGADLIIKFRSVSIGY